ncbi:MAG: c-type cytochrome [Vicinamibacterales bacterium]
MRLTTSTLGTVVMLVVLVQAGSSWATAQTGGFPPKTFANLQVLPKTSAPADVMATMKGFAQALGVRCQHCHVGREGQPLDQFDFVTDTPSTKLVARRMMRLVETINTELAGGGGEPAARVTCYTCHRGAARPVHTPG